MKKIAKREATIFEKTALKNNSSYFITYETNNAEAAASVKITTCTKI